MRNVVLRVGTQHTTSSRGERGNFTTMAFREEQQELSDTHVFLFITSIFYVLAHTSPLHQNDCKGVERGQVGQDGSFGTSEG